MASHFTLTLDTQAPANPSLRLNDGSMLTGSVAVTVKASSPSADIATMKVWGDLDMPSDPRFGVDEDDSQWIVYDDEFYVQITAGDGAKTIYCRLRDDLGNATPIFSANITLDTSRPVVTLSTPPNHGRISAVPGFDECVFGFTSSVDFDRWEVRVVPAANSSHSQGILLQDDDGDFEADDEVTVTIDGTDLSTSAPGNAGKIVKVFVRHEDIDGIVWSP